MTLHISYNDYIINESSIMDELEFIYEYPDEDNIEINAEIDGNTVGSVNIEEMQNAFWYFEDCFSDDEYYEMFPDDKVFIISSISIAKAYMGRGVAKELMRLAILEAREHGYHNVYLNASPMGFSGLKLPELVKFYEKFGFKTILDQGNNVQMILNL